MSHKLKPEIKQELESEFLYKKETESGLYALDSMDLEILINKIIYKTIEKNI